eukprot:7167849-Pyramimonas_sp.AAC.1
MTIAYSVAGQTEHVSDAFDSKPLAEVVKASLMQPMKATNFAQTRWQAAIDIVVEKVKEGIPEWQADEAELLGVPMKPVVHRLCKNPAYPKMPTMSKQLESILAAIKPHHGHQLFEA